jgi:hypothetical protein
MKHLVKSLAVFGVVAAMAAGEASAQSPASFGIGGGVSIPSGSTSDALSTGWHGIALVRYMPATVAVGFQIDGMYHRLGVEDGGLDLDLSTQIINGTANVVFAFPVSEETRFRPYLIGGGGIYNFDLKGDDAPSTTESSTDWGLNVGAGFDIGFGGGTLFLEGRFHNVFTDGDDTKLIPITLGIRFGGS